MNEIRPGIQVNLGDIVRDYSFEDGHVLLP
jgi:hypothetical protein